MRTAFCLIALCLVVSADAFADIRIDRRQQVLRGTPAASPRAGKETGPSIETSVIVKGNRRMTTSKLTGELIDLDEEKIYQIDHVRRRYTATPFDQLRRLAEETDGVGTEKAAEAAGDVVKESIEMAQALDNLQRSHFERVRRQTGRRQDVNGFDAFEVVTTMRVGDGDATTSVTTVEWLAPEIGNYQEVDAFERRYQARLNTTQTDHEPAVADALQPIMPAAGPFSNKFMMQDDGSTGIPVLSITTTGGEEAGTATPGVQAATPSTRSRFGRLAGRLGRQALGVPELSPRLEDAPAPSGRVTVQDEIVRVTTEVSVAEVSIPKAYKLETAKRR